MRIVHVITRINVGGTARWLETLIPEQRANGHDVLLLAGDVPASETTDEAFARLGAVRVSTLSQSLSPGPDARAALELRRQIANFEPNIVNSHTFKAGLVARTAAVSLGSQRPALVHTFHGHLLYGYGSATARAFAAAERAASLATDGLIAVGEAVREDLLRAGVGRARPFVSITPGIARRALLDREEARTLLGIPDDRVSVGWMGRLVKVKRPDRAVMAARSVPDTEWIMAGDGPLASDVRSRVPRNVRLIGLANPSLLWSAADIAVCSSDNEGMPYSLVEALASGIPIVTTRAGSAPELVEDGASGFVVEQSAHALAGAVQRLAVDPGLRLTMADAALHRAQELLAPSTMSAAHEELYTQAILHRRAR